MTVISPGLNSMAVLLVTVIRSYLRTTQQTSLRQRNPLDSRLRGYERNSR
jgi:hypothetical protein